MAKHEELDFPISKEKIEQLKQGLNNISTEIWDIIEMSPEVREIIGSLYKEDQLLAKSIEILWDNVYKIKFFFPEYKLSKDKLDHVSINQMGQALVQWLFLSFGLSIKQNWANSPMSYDTFLLNRNNALYRRDQRTMRKKLRSEEDAYLIYQVIPFIKKGNTYSIKATLLRAKEVFLDWSVECIMQDEYLIDEEKEQHQDIRHKNKPWDTASITNTAQSLKDAISMARVTCVENINTKK